MEHYLKVKNFGPLKDVEIDLTNKDLIVLIGPQASGKSTIAKLLGIFTEFGLWKPGVEINTFFEDIKAYGIEWLGREHISYHSPLFSFGISSRDKTTATLEKPLLVFKFATSIPNRYDTRIDTLREIVNSKHGYLAPLVLNELHSILSDLLFFIEKIHEEYTDSNALYQLPSKSEIKDWLQALQSLKNFSRDSKDEILNALSFCSGSFNRIMTFLEIQRLGFIPTERNLVPTIKNLALSPEQQLQIPIYLSKFLQKLKHSQTFFKQKEIHFLNVTYSLENDKEYILLGDGEKVEFHESSSGLQSVIPIVLVVDYLASSDNFSNHTFIIEEPELNLYPSTQKKLVEFLIEKCTKNGNKLIITTHSPYILTALNNHITAHHVAQTRPEMADEVAAKIPQEQWLDYSKVGAYYVADGTAKDIMHKEHPIINYEQIDDVADDLGETYDSLIEMEYRKAN